MLGGGAGGKKYSFGGNWRASRPDICVNIFLCIFRTLIWKLIATWHCDIGLRGYTVCTQHQTMPQGQRLVVCASTKLTISSMHWQHVMWFNIQMTFTGYVGSPWRHYFKCMLTCWVVHPTPAPGECPRRWAPPTWWCCLIIWDISRIADDKITP